MGTLAETAIVDYRLSFAYQKKHRLLFSISFCSKQISVFHFQLTNGSLPFPFSDCRKQTEFVVFR
jgi:hypothetical protein